MTAVISQELLAQAKEFAGSDDALATFLKTAGLTPSLGVIAFSHVAEVSAADAKRAIHRSGAWSGLK